MLAGAPVPRVLRKSRRVVPATVKWPPLMEQPHSEVATAGGYQTLWLFCVFYGKGLVSRHARRSGEAGHRSRKTGLSPGDKKCHKNPLTACRKYAILLELKHMSVNDDDNRNTRFAEIWGRW